MCQQWITLIGLIADVTGFLLIVREWHLMFRRHAGEKIREIDQLYARIRRRQDGLPPEDPHSDEFWSMGKHMYMGLMEDITYRGKLVYVGAGLVILGFALQGLGTLPGGLPWAHITSCSALTFAPTQ